jgi:hypothetical protein
MNNLLVFILDFPQKLRSRTKTYHNIIFCLNLFNNNKYDGLLSKTIELWISIASRKNFDRLRAPFFFGDVFLTITLLPSTTLLWKLF